MVVIVLMIDFEDGEGLCLGGSGVVTALGGLDGLTSFRGTAGGRFGVFAFGVGGGRRESRGCEAEGQSDGEEVGGDLHDLFP